MWPHRYISDRHACENLIYTIKYWKTPHRLESSPVWVRMGILRLCAPFSLVGAFNKCFGVMEEVMGRAARLLLCATHGFPLEGTRPFTHVDFK